MNHWICFTIFFIMKRLFYFRYLRVLIIYFNFIFIFFQEWTVVESRGLAVISTGSAGRTMTPASGIQLLDEKFPSFFKKKIATIIFVIFFRNAKWDWFNARNYCRKVNPAFWQNLPETVLSLKFLADYLAFQIFTILIWLAKELHVILIFVFLQLISSLISILNYKNELKSPSV